MNPLAKQLSDIGIAYIAGRLQKSEASSDRPIEELDNTSMISSPAERILLQRCNRYRSNALHACREGKYAIADQFFTAIDSLLKTEAFSPAGRLMIQSANEAALSYLDYRHERFASGTERIYRVLTYDEVLEETYGIANYHIHRLRQLVNLMRLKRRQGEEAEALKIGLALIDYLEQKVSSLPFPTAWDSQRLASVEQAYTNFLFEQTIFELMFLVAGQEKASLSLSPALTQHTGSASLLCQLSPRSHRWLAARLALQDQNIENFLELAQPLVAAGPGGAPWLWYGIVMDLVIVCRQFSLPPAQQLLQAITADMPDWRWSSLPPFWRQVLENEPVHTSL
jgi:hypothetical protein